MRLIDADALRDKRQLVEVTDGSWRTTACVVLATDIDQAPTIEAEPVKHGRWVHCNGKSNLWYCSECGEKIMYNPTRRTYNIEKKPVHEVNKRCRNCGAKMDGGDASE